MGENPDRKPDGWNSSAMSLQSKTLKENMNLEIPGL